jgi:hypothetical protein
MSQSSPSQLQDDRTANGNCDHVDTMAKRVQIGEDLLTACFEQEDRGETPDWELLRGLPGRCRPHFEYFLETPSPSSIYHFTLISLRVQLFRLNYTHFGYL